MSYQLKNKPATRETSLHLSHICKKALNDYLSPEICRWRSLPSSLTFPWTANCSLPRTTELPGWAEKVSFTKDQHLNLYEKNTAHTFPINQRLLRHVGGWLISHFDYQLLGETQRIAFRLLLSTCVCLCVCMPHLWTPGNGLRYRRRFFLKLRGMTPDVACKSFTQIGLQIPRCRTKWWPWNTIIGHNSAIY